MCRPLGEKASGFGRQAGFVRPRISKITVTKEKDRKEKKKEQGDGKGKRKKQWLHSKFYNDYFGVFGRKKLLDAKGHLAITLSKIRLDTYICICIQERNEKNNWRSKEGYTCSNVKETIHLYDKQFHVVWQDIRAPNEKDPDCHMTGTWTKLQLVQGIWSLFFTLYSLLKAI